MTDNGPTMVEYEYRTLNFPRQTTRAEARRVLSEYAEYEQWELQRMRLYFGGARRAVLRRKIIRVRRTA